MKKTNYLFMTLVMSILLISCGGKNEKKEGSSDEITSSESDISLDQLICEHDGSTLKSNTKHLEHIIDVFTQNIKQKGEKENFTGVGVEKDQNDSILDRAEIKNGWLIRYTQRIKKGNKYITISDFTFDNGKIKDGFLLENNNETASNNQIIEGFDYFDLMKKYKNGKENIEWDIAFYPNDNIYLNAVWDEEGGRIINSNEVIGLHLNYSKTLNLKQTITGFKQLAESDYSKITGNPKPDRNDFYFVDADKQTILNTLKNLKKEVKGFDYWEE